MEKTVNKGGCRQSGTLSERKIRENVLFGRGGCLLEVTRSVGLGHFKPDGALNGSSDFNEIC